MKRIETKAERLAIREANFSDLMQRGAVRETYKDLEIFFGPDDAGNFYLRIYKGTAAHPFVNCYYRSAESRTFSVEQWRRGADYREERRKEPKQQTGAAKCAAAVREELKKTFPGVVFRVNSDTYSGGDSVRVYWNDGPTSKMVEEITSKYQEGHFDGMQDLYEYSNSRDDIPQVKFIFEERRQSEETKKTLDAAFVEKFPGEGWEMERERERYAREIWVNSPLPVGAVVTGIVSTGKTCGMISELYRIAYTGGKQEEGPKAIDQKPATVSGEVQLIDYSEKAFAVVGDTYPIKEKLTEMGGKYNMFLKCGAGFIFSKKRFDQVRNLILCK